MNKISYLSLAFSLCLYGCGNKLSVQSNKWELDYTNGINVYHDGHEIAHDINAEYCIANTIVNSRKYSKPKFTVQDFTDQCKAHSQVPCIYWTPFTDWGKNPEREVPGTSYKYKDVYLYANGKP